MEYINWQNSTWLSNTTDNIINPATEDKQNDLITTTGALALAITRAIDETAFDLNVGAFSETTNITDDYILDNIELNFSTTEVKTITVTSSDWTILRGGSVDTSSSNLGYNTTKQNFFLCFGKWFNADENITVAVTQTSGACSMDCVLKIKSGTNTLLGNPSVKIISEDGKTVADVDQFTNGLRVISTEHWKVHDGKYFITSWDVVVDSCCDLDILIKNPAVNFPHIRSFIIHSSTAPVDIKVFEWTTVSDDWVALDVFNANRNSVTTNNLDFFSWPTITDKGALRYSDAITGWKTTWGATPDHLNELIFKQDENYLLRIDNKSGLDTDIIYQITFYE